MTGLNTTSELHKIHNDFINIRQNNLCSQAVKYYPYSNGRSLFYIRFIFWI